MLSNQSHLYSSYADPNTTARIDKAWSFGFGKPLIVEKEERVSVDAPNECPENQGKLRNWQSNFNRFSFDNVKAPQKGYDFQFSRPNNVQQYYRKSEKKDGICNSGQAEKSLINFATKFPRKQFHKGQYCKENQFNSYQNFKISTNPESAEKIKSEEWGKEREYLKKKVKEMEGTNLLLKKEIESLSNGRVDQEQQMKGMIEQLENASALVKKQNENINCLELEKFTLKIELQKFKSLLKSQEKKRNSLGVKSAIVNLILPPSLDFKGLSTENGCQTQYEDSFLQDYNEVVSFLGIKVSEGECRSQLLLKVKQIFQDLSKRAAKMAVLQLQKTKLKNQLRNNQMQIGHLSSQNYLLQQEMVKYHHLIDEYNQEISILNLRIIQNQMRYKSLKGDDQTEESSSDRYLL